MGLSPRLYRGIFWLGTAVFAGLLVGGLVQSLRLFHSVPGINSSTLLQANMESLLGAGDQDRALEQLELALALDSGVNPPLLYLEMGKIRLEKGSAAEAVKDLEKAVQALPQDPQAHYYLGAALQEFGDPARAVAHLETAVRLNPGSARFLCRLGTALEEQGLWQQALGVYQRAVEVRGSFVEAHRRMGDLYLQQGYRAEAVAAYQRWVQLKPESALARQKLQAAQDPSSPLK